MRTHRGSGIELAPAHSNDDPDFSVGRPASTSRTKSVPSSALPQRPSSYISHGNHERKPSNADSTFPGEERYTRSQLVESCDSLGLHIIHDPKEPECDIIFVHGLGGTAHQTWSWNRDLTYFWPAWLACELGLSSARSLTFGYNSNFKGAATKLNITDFAKELLFHMLVFAQGFGGSFGTRPIIFVAHSMGGLVVKKAYILGKHDSTYATIISETYGMLFLGTPHRGSHHAKILNTILSTAPLGAPPKAYIADLETSSLALQDINE
ncbi:MAG: hypothetical protein LQ342_007133 [Letrouitia transgressa]|nr:MAG: hypothetical protein LQ342_007133 [Letrouitia transgressa]